MQQVVGDVLDDAPHVRGVLRLEVDVVDEDEEHPAGDVLHGAARRGQHDAFRRGRRRRRRREQVEGAAAVHQGKRRDHLRHVVLEHDEVVLGEVGDEAAVRVPRDDVGRDRRDAGPERGLATGRRGLLAQTGRARSPPRAPTAVRARSRRRDGMGSIIARACGILGPMGPGPAPPRRPRPALTRRQFLERAAARRQLLRGARRPLRRRPRLEQPAGPGLCRRRRRTARWCGRCRSTDRERSRRRSARCWAAPASTPGSSPICRDSIADRLVTPADDLFVRTAAPAGLRPDPTAWRVALRGSSDVARRRGVGGRACGRGAAHGRAPHRVRRQQQSAELRPDERHRVARRAARPRAGAAAPSGVRPPAVLVSGLDHDGAAVAPFAARRELGAAAGHARRRRAVSRHAG